MTCPFWDDQTYTCGKGADCTFVTGQDENIVKFVPVYDPVYKNKSRRWLAMAVLIASVGFLGWVLKGMWI